jgi:hypothetical protein
MLSKLEKKILQVKSVRIQGVKYEFKRCTPEDFLGKEGIPISKWQSEAEFIANKERADGTTLAEMQKLWSKLFKRSIVSINDKDDNLDTLIELLVENNYFVSSQLYNEIVIHCLQFKKKTIMQRLFQKQVA